MKPNYLKIINSLALICLFFIPIQISSAQAGLPEVLDTASLSSQMDYLNDRTRVYEGYRAIREDIFQKMKQNVVDSLEREKQKVAQLQGELTQRDAQIATLTSDLSQAKNEREEAIRTKNSLSLLGIQMQKGLYNTVMWIIVLGLAALAGILFLMFKRSFIVTSQTKKELKTIQEEFDEHRKSAREKYEKLVISHHNEIMKLKNL
jgi:Fe2+ transport system protein B